VGGFANVNYWISSELNNSYAWFQFFNGGDQAISIEEGAFYVRAVRAF
jgi:hypothetical protein